jgi:hypothetical protein
MVTSRIFGSGDCPNTPFGLARTKSAFEVARVALPESAVAIVSHRLANHRSASGSAYRHLAADSMRCSCHSRTTWWRLRFPVGLA